jgi:hypothetical protein
MANLRIGLLPRVERPVICIVPEESMPRLVQPCRVQREGGLASWAYRGMGSPLGTLEPLDPL